LTRFKKEIYGDSFVNQLVAQTTNKKTHERPYAWVDNNNAYSHITGALRLPTFDFPGFLLTVGVRYNDFIKIDCLEEFESDDPYLLIDKAKSIQKDYGQEVIKNWWGDPVELMSIVGEKNKKNPIYISSPADYNQSDAFLTYVARLKTALSPSNKSLYIHNCNLLRNHISSFQRNNKIKEHENIALFVTGSLLHTLLLARPWEYALDIIELIPTDFKDYAAYANEQVEKDIMNEIYGVVV